MAAAPDRGLARFGFADQRARLAAQTATAAGFGDAAVTHVGLPFAGAALDQPRPAADPTLLARLAHLPR
jgi:hypothetical protein